MPSVQQQVLRLIAVAIVSAIVVSCEKSGTQSPGAGSVSDSAIRQTLSIGVLPVVPSLPYYVAKDSGCFENAGLTINERSYESTSSMITDLLTGRVDALPMVAAYEFVEAVATSGKDLRSALIALAEQDSTVHRLEVSPGSSIRTLADLSGKKLGLLPGPAMQAHAKVLLEKYAKDVTLVPVPPALQGSALMSGQVDAVLSLEPSGTLIEARGGRVLQMNPLYEGVQKPFPAALSAYLAGPDSKPGIARFNVCLIQAADAMTTRPELAQKALVTYMNVPAGLAPKVGLYRYRHGSDFDSDVVKKIAALYRRVGAIPTEPNLSKVAENAAR